MPTPYAVASLIFWNGDRQRVVYSQPPYTYAYIGNMEVRLLQSDGSPANNEGVKFTITAVSGAPNFYTTGSVKVNTLTVYTDVNGFAFNNYDAASSAFQKLWPSAVNPGTGAGTAYEIVASSVGNPTLTHSFTQIQVAEQGAGQQLTGSLYTDGVAPKIYALNTNATNANPVTGGATSNAWNVKYFSPFSNAILSMLAVTQELVGAPAGTTFVGGSIIKEILTDSTGLSIVPSIICGNSAGEFELKHYETGYPAGISYSVRFKSSFPNTPAFLQVVSGNGQSTPVTVTFADPLVARTVNGSLVPVVGFNVTFTVPATGASCTFGGSLTQVVTSIAGGIATSFVPVANGILGTYSVVVSSAGCPDITFTLTNSTAVSYVAPPPLHYCAQ